MTSPKQDTNFDHTRPQLTHSLTSSRIPMKMHIRAIKRALRRALKKHAQSCTLEEVQSNSFLLSPLVLTILPFFLVTLLLGLVHAQPSEQPERPSFSEDGSLLHQHAIIKSSPVSGGLGRLEFFLFTVPGC